MADLSAQDQELLRLYLNDPSGENQVFTLRTLQRLYDDAGSLGGAAAAGWRIKAATVHDWYLANVDGSFLSRDQVFTHCIAMAEMYDKSGGSQTESVSVIMTGSSNDPLVETSEF